MRIRHRGTAALLALLWWLPASPAQEPAPAFEAFLWIDAAFPFEARRAGLEALGITGIDAEGPAGVARAAASGLPFYVDHAVPKGFLHVRRQAFDEARERWRRDPVTANLARPPCLRDPKARATALADLMATLDALGSSAPAFLSFTDEPSATRGINPIDWCRDVFCADAFPRFLAERWGSEALARAVWASRWPKDGTPAQVDTDEARRALFHEVGTLDTVVRWNDTRAFADVAFADALSYLAEQARRARPGLRLALLGASMPSAFGGFDWEQLGPRFDAFEPYDWGAARDLAQSVAPHGAFYHTITTREGGAAPLQHELWRYFLRGDRGVILFDASTWAGADSRPTAPPPIAAVTPLLATFQAERLAPWRRSAPLRPQVAILHGMPSTRMHWLLDTRYDGASWFNRLGSYEARESSEARNREAWAALLSDLGFSYRFVTPSQLRDGSLIEDGVVALVLPRAIAMSDAEVAAIARFAATRFVIADCQLALFNARLQLRDRPALDGLFGIRRPEIRSVDDFAAQEPDSRPGAIIPPAEPGIRAEGATSAQSAGNAPMLLVHGKGANRAVYLNMRIGSYLRDRLEHPEAAERLRAMVRPLFVAGRLRPRFEVSQQDAGPRFPFAVHARKDGGDTLIAVELSATTGARPIDWSGPVGTAAPRLIVKLPGAFEVTDLLTGERHGSETVIEAQVTATRPALFRLSP